MSTRGPADLPPGRRTGTRAAGVKGHPPDSSGNRPVSLLTHLQHRLGGGGGGSHVGWRPPQCSREPADADRRRPLPVGGFHTLSGAKTQLVPPRRRPRWAAVRGQPGAAGSCRRGMPRGTRSCSPRTPQKESRNSVHPRKRLFLLNPLAAETHQDCALEPAAPEEELGARCLGEGDPLKAPTAGAGGGCGGAGEKPPLRGRLSAAWGWLPLALWQLWRPRDARDLPARWDHQASGHLESVSVPRASPELNLSPLGGLLPAGSLWGEVGSFLEAPLSLGPPEQPPRAHICV